MPLTTLRCVDPGSLVSKRARFASFRFTWWRSSELTGKMMNSPLLPGMQASQSGENVVRGRNQECCGCGSDPMSPSGAAAGCAGVSNNVPIPPSTPSVVGHDDTCADPHSHTQNSC